MREVSKPIEEALNTVQGIKEITSTSLEGHLDRPPQFNLGVDVAVAQQDVQAKVARIRRAAAAGHRGADHPALRPERRGRSCRSRCRATERPIRELTDLADEVDRRRASRRSRASAA